MEKRVLFTVFFTFTALFSLSSSLLASEPTPANPHSKGVITLTSSTIRTYHQGDTANYTSLIAGLGIAMHGQLTQSINNTITNPSGKKCLEHTLSTVYSGVGSPPSLNIRLLYYQDNQHSLYECGHYDNKTESYVFITNTPSTPDGIALSIESPLKVGNSTSNLIAYTDGTWKDCTRSVSAIENVNTQLGVYEAYKIMENCSSNADNSNTTTNIWFVPSLYTVKESGAGDVIAGDFVLDNYISTVPLTMQKF